MSAEKTPYTYRASSPLMPTNDLTKSLPCKAKGKPGKNGVFGQGGSVLHEHLTTHSCYKGFLGFNCKLNICFLQRSLGLCTISPRAKIPQLNRPFGSSNSDFLTFSLRQMKWKCQTMSSGRKQYCLSRRKNSGRSGASSH